MPRNRTIQNVDDLVWDTLTRMTYDIRNKTGNRRWSVAQTLEMLVLNKQTHYSNNSNCDLEEACVRAIHEVFGSK